MTAPKGQKRQDPNARGAQGRTPFHRAAREGRLEVLKQLHEGGADIHIGDATGEQALQMAARKGHLDCVEYLITAGAEVNYLPSVALSRYPETALSSAVRKLLGGNNIEIVSALLRAGADPNIGGAKKRYVAV